MSNLVALPVVERPLLAEVFSKYYAVILSSTMKRAYFIVMHFP